MDHTAWRSGSWTASALPLHTAKRLIVVHSGTAGNYWMNFLCPMYWRRFHGHRFRGTRAFFYAGPLAVFCAIVSLFYHHPCCHCDSGIKRTKRGEIRCHFFPPPMLQTVVNGHSHEASPGRRVVYLPSSLLVTSTGAGIDRSFDSNILA
uniref:Uncharacterized protein n=1 Tax=Anopheles culicifacies TaxID=139723 RepID=A0A182M9C0_9DIPT